MRLLSTCAILSAGLIGGCSTMNHDTSSSSKTQAMDIAPATQPMITHAVAMLYPLGDSKAHGWVKFAAAEDGSIKVTAEISGLAPGSKHAIHIHEFGDCSSADGKSTGGHYNPEGHKHGMPGSAEHHAGDFGNLTADDKGNATLDITVHDITLWGEHDPIIGRGMIVHADPDDGGQPTGNAGGRIACGVIGIAK